jgi:hypothetical protein
MRKLSAFAFSFGLMISVAGCSSWDDSFFTSHSDDAPLLDPPALALTIGHGALLRGAGEEDGAASMEDWRRAAEAGDRDAQYQLATAYRVGIAGAPDAETAAAWYAKAAVGGNASAQRHLGYMYAMGEGVARDALTAYVWMNIAAANLAPGWEHGQAVANREIVARELSADEIAEAHRLSGQWAAAGAPAPAETDTAATIENFIIEAEFGTEFGSEFEAEIEELGFLGSVDVLTAI